MAELLNTKHYNILDICIKLSQVKKGEVKSGKKLNGEAKKICFGMEMLLVYGKRRNACCIFNFNTKRVKELRTLETDRQLS